MREKIAVLLLNLGGPDSLAAIRPFLYNLFSDREIIKLPLQPALAWFIARGRSKKVAVRYQAIGGKSPILDLTKEQAAAVETSLNRDGERSYKVSVGMRYWHPLIPEAVEQIAAGEFDRLIVVSLFPHYSRATTGSCLTILNKALAEHSPPPATVIESWYDNPGYLDALADTVEEGLAGFADRGGVKVIFSAHALPQEFIEQGDPYEQHLRSTIAGVTERVAGLDWTLTFQSRSGPVKWMEPQTDASIAALGESGCKKMLIVPISFVSDHIETLYEIDIMYRDLALEHGVTEFIRSPSLNSRPKFIEALAGLVRNR